MYAAVVVSADPAVFAAVAVVALHYWQALHFVADSNCSFQMIV